MSTPFVRDMRSAPNLITLSRIALILAAGPVYFYLSPVAAMTMAVIAGLTDYADGMVARATGQVTRLGEILDQFCDLAYESLVLLVAITQGFFPPIVLAIYLVRELWVTCIRRYMAGLGLNIPSTLPGKLKTNFIMWGFLPCFLSMSGVLPGLEPFLGWLGRGGVYFGLLLSYVSGATYTRSFLQAYNQTAGGPQAVRTR